jgi:cytochrome c-type biogenesis protein
MNLSGNPLDFVFAFIGGVLISFTPCVFPLIPVTAAYIGATATKSKFQGFVLSLIYVTGIAVTYSILGLIASLTGQLFGRLSSFGVTYIVVGAVIVIFGLSMLDLFYISLPNVIKLPKFRKQDYFSTLLLGLASGLIIGPCVTPALASILAYLAAKKNALYGAVLLLSFAYGMGIVLILVGSFSGMLLALPKPQKWMVYIKKLGAIIILASGIYFIIIGIKRI